MPLILNTGIKHPTDSQGYLESVRSSHRLLGEYTNQVYLQFTILLSLILSKLVILLYIYIPTLLMSLCRQMYESGFYQPTALLTLE